MVDTTILLGNAAHLRTFFKATSSDEINNNKSSSPKETEKQAPTPFLRSVEDSLFELAEYTLLFTSLYFINPFGIDPNSSRSRPFFEPSLEFQFYRIEPSPDPAMMENPPIGIVLEYLTLAASSLKKLSDEEKSRVSGHHFVSNIN